MDFNVDIATLPLPKRAIKALGSAMTIHELLMLDPAEILKKPNLGRRIFNDIVACLDAANLLSVSQLKDEITRSGSLLQRTCCFKECLAVVPVRS